MAPGRIKKWTKQLKADFATKVQNRLINIRYCNDNSYIDSVRERFYPDRPIDTFRANFRASAKEIEIGQKIDNYNRGKTVKSSYNIKTPQARSHLPFQF